MRDFLKYQLPPLLWIVFVYVVSSIPNLPLSDRLPPGTARIAHAGTFLVLCWLAQRAFYEQKILPPLRESAFLGAILFSCVYGVLDEFDHNLLPGRSPDKYNLIADAAGIILYAALRLILPHKRNGGGSVPKIRDRAA